VATAKHIQS